MPIVAGHAALVGTHILAVAGGIVPIAAAVFPTAIHDDVRRLDVEMTGR
jgi:hypothetical protein